MALLGLWPVDVIVVPSAPTVQAGGVRPRSVRPSRPVVILRAGRVVGEGAAAVDVAMVRELVRGIAARGAALVQMAPVSEVVAALTMRGASVASVGARGEPVSVFSDDELFALSVWAARRLH
jgi:hypothetical protein